MSSIFLLILISAISLPEIARSADTNEAVNGSPMVMVKSTLKNWYSMYSSYRDEIRLGYCWADYFVDVKKLVDTLAGPRLLGINPDDPTPLIAILKSWFNDGSETSTTKSITKNVENEKSQTNNNNNNNNNGDNFTGDNYNDPNLYDEGTDNPSYQWKSPDNNNGVDQFTVHQENPYTNVKKSPRYFYPGIYNLEKRSNEPKNENLQSILNNSMLKTVKKSDDYSISKKSIPRGLSDIFISVLGLNTPPGLGPLMLGGKGSNPIFYIMLKVIGTVMRIGRKALDTIQGVSILACSKDYLISKMFYWIDS